MNASNVLPLQTDHRGEQRSSEAVRTGQAIVSMLRQAADVAKRNEERAKAQTHALAQELHAAEARVQALEAELDNLQQRAVEAEEWLIRVFQEVKTGLIEPLVGRSGGRAA